MDRNPHQVDVALFAIRLPLSKGIILADEVGLGKTIEASLIIAQRRAERKAPVLLTVLATLRKQCQMTHRQIQHPVRNTGKRYIPPVRMLNALDQPGKVTNLFVQLVSNRGLNCGQNKWGLVVIEEAAEV